MSAATKPRNPKGNPNLSYKGRAKPWGSGRTKGSAPRAPGSGRKTIKPHERDPKTGRILPKKGGGPKRKTAAPVEVVGELLPAAVTPMAAAPKVKTARALLEAVCRGEQVSTPVLQADGSVGIVLRYPTFEERMAAAVKLLPYQESPMAQKAPEEKDSAVLESLQQVVKQLPVARDVAAD